MIRFSTIILVPLLLGACQPHDTKEMRASPAVPLRQVATEIAPSEATASDAAQSGEAIIADNERAIAKNRRVKQILIDYRQRDPDKLDRLEASCTQELGAASDRESAMRIFECVRQGW